MCVSWVWISARADYLKWDYVFCVIFYVLFSFLFSLVTCNSPDSAAKTVASVVTLMDWSSIFVIEVLLLLNLIIWLLDFSCRSTRALIKWLCRWLINKNLCYHMFSSWVSPQFKLLHHLGLISLIWSAIYSDCAWLLVTDFSQWKSCPPNRYVLKK